MRSDMPNIMQPTNFTDFNPLDVLATAASLQSITRIDSDTCTERRDSSNDTQEEENGDQDTEDGDLNSCAGVEVATQVAPDDTVVNTGNTVTVDYSDVNGDTPNREGTVPIGDKHTVAEKRNVSNILKVLRETGSQVIADGKLPIVTLKDSTKLDLPSAQSGKALTVLKINKPQASDHSYAYVCQLRNLKQEEDEGYSSRSSIEDEEHDHGVTSPISDKSSPGPETPIDKQLSGGEIFRTPQRTVTGSGLAKKSARIVILSKDTNLRNLITESKLVFTGGVPQVKGKVLQSLLSPTATMAPKTISTTVAMATETTTVSSNNGTSNRVAGAKKTVVETKTETVPVKSESCNITAPSESVNVEIQSESAETVASTSQQTEKVVAKETDGDTSEEHMELDDGSGEMPESTVHSDTSDDKKGKHVIRVCSPVEEILEQPHVQATRVQKQTRALPSSVGSENLSIKADPVGGRSDSDCVQSVTSSDTNVETTIGAKETICDKMDGVGESQDVVLDTEKAVPSQTESIRENAASASNAKAERDTSDCQTDNNKQGNSTEKQETIPVGSSSPSPAGAEESSGRQSASCSQANTVCTVPNDHKPCAVSESVSTPDGAESDVQVIPDTEEKSLSNVSSSDSVGTVNNQYIIEDDESPVTKFASSKVFICDDDDTPVGNKELPVVSNTTSTDTKTSEPPVVASSALDAPATVSPPLEKPEISRAIGQVTSTVVPPPQNVMRVIPVVNNRGVVTQVIPKTVQYVTAVPVAGKAPLKPGAGKGPISTLLVPASVVLNGTHSSKAAVTTSALKGSLDVGTSGAFSRFTGSQPPKGIHRTVTLPLAVTPLNPGNTLTSSRKDTQTTKTDLVNISSPLSGQIAPHSGRVTPLSGRVTPLSGNVTPSRELPGSPGEKINLLISSGQIKETAEQCDQMGTPTKERASIGTVGSLSWQNFGSNNGSGLIPLGTSNQREFIRIQGSQIKSGVSPVQLDGKAQSPSSSKPPSRPPSINILGQVDLEDDVSKSSEDSVSIPYSDDSGVATSECQDEDTNISSARDSPAISEGGTPKTASTPKPDPQPWSGELHPLVDHDYCMFTEFNAQIQSSIIATTETKTKTERKYTKKAKAARTKAGSVTAIEEKVAKVTKALKVTKRGRQGRYKKRANAKSDISDSGEKDSGAPVVDDKIALRKELKRQRALERKKIAEQKRLAKEKRNYVKITGSYQDEFVYFTTRNNRGRPRKAIDNNTEPGKVPAVGGVNVFDWYKDLSKADKTSRFGSPSVVEPATGNVNTVLSQQPLDSKVNVSGPGATPLHESEVADLVCELSNIVPDDNGVTGACTPPSSPAVGLNETTKTVGSEVDLNLIAEQVRNMLNSMGEAELKMWEERLAPEDVGAPDNTATTGLNDTSFDRYLTNFAPDGGPSLSQTSVSSQLCDLDEINDSDLLPTEIANMSAILGDLATPVKPVGPAVPAEGLKTTTEGYPGIGKLDRTELFPDMSTPDVPMATDVTVPELTVVSMYWNDLPGLLINNVQFVRLVDIHKQVLPAKDTGILKKRCQMMGLEIGSCTEMQRDFLVRYANAAKSKSTVIISRESAQKLIGFYVNPKFRTARNTKHRSLVKEEPPSGDSVSSEQASSHHVDVSIVKSEPQEGTAEPSTGESPLAPEAAVRSPKGRRGRRPGTKRKLDDPEHIPQGEGATMQLRQNLVVHQEVKRSARLKHKRVNFAEMVHGNFESPDEESPVKAKSVKLSEPREVGAKSTTNLGEVTPSGSGKHTADDDQQELTAKVVCSEELEIRRLRNKARRRGLTVREKRRLRRLREKIRQRQKLNREKRARVVRKIKLVSQKSKKKLQETHVYTRKYNQEHCYAACPEASDKAQGGHSEQGVKQELVTETTSLESVGVTPQDENLAGSSIEELVVETVESIDDMAEITQVTSSAMKIKVEPEEEVLAEPPPVVLSVLHREAGVRRETCI